MSSHEQPPNQPAERSEGLGCFLMALLFAAAWGVTKLLPDMRGGLLAYLIVPPILLVIWALLSAILAKYFLVRSNGEKPIAASIGYALLLIIAISFALSVIDHLNPYHGPTYHGP